MRIYFQLPQQLELSQPNLWQSLIYLKLLDQPPMPDLFAQPFWMIQNFTNSKNFSALVF